MPPTASKSPYDLCSPSISITRSAMCASLPDPETGLGVDRVTEGFPGNEPPQVVDEDADHGFLPVVEIARDVRRNGHARHRPQRRVGRQRLLDEDIERRAGDGARPDRVDQRV